MKVRKVWIVFIEIGIYDEWERLIDSIYTTYEYALNRARDIAEKELLKEYIYSGNNIYWSKKSDYKILHTVEIEEVDIVK